jgi:hypothetical protein
VTIVLRGDQQQGQFGDRLLTAVITPHQRCSHSSAQVIGLRILPTNFFALMGHHTPEFCPSRAAERLGRVTRAVDDGSVTIKSRRHSGRLYLKVLEVGVESALNTLGLAGDPFKRTGGDQAQHQQILATKRSGVLPRVTILVGALKGHIEDGAIIGFLPPDAGGNRAMSNAVSRLVL